MADSYMEPISCKAIFTSPGCNSFVIGAISMIPPLLSVFSQKRVYPITTGNRARVCCVVDGKIRQFLKQSNLSCEPFRIQRREPLHSRMNDQRNHALVCDIRAPAHVCQIGFCWV